MTDGEAGRLVVTDEGFTAFCDAEFSPVLGALTLWCGDRQVAEEMTSEAFARAFRDWHRVGRLDAPGAWVRHVAMNLARSTFRRRRIEQRAKRRLQSQSLAGQEQPDIAQAVTVREALQRLTADHRTVLVLRHYLQLPVAEVAEIMGRNPSAVTSLTQRAAVAFRNELDAQPLGEEVSHDR